MKKETILLSIFVGLACLITVSTIYYSEEFRRKNVEAESFGISPPYIKVSNLRPGDIYEQSIRVLRGSSDTEQKVTFHFDDSEIANWFIVDSSKDVIIEEGQRYVNINFKLKVPDDVYNGNYEGRLYFIISSSNNKNGVSVRLGARADIDIDVIGGQTISSDRFENKLQNTLADNELVERLQGRFVMRTESSGQLYYLHPNVKKIFYLGEASDVLKLAKNEARGINNDLLSKIEIDLSALEGNDSDGDGLPDLWEESIGTNINLVDTDNDGFNDLDELKGGFSPLEKDMSLDYNIEVANSLSGFLLLQVEDRGQVWYMNPVNNKRILLNDFENVLKIIKNLALGISEENYQKLLSQ